MADTGTRVPRNTHAPLTLPGMLSSTGHCDQLIVGCVMLSSRLSFPILAQFQFVAKHGHGHFFDFLAGSSKGKFRDSAPPFQSMTSATLKPDTIKAEGAPNMTAIGMPS